MNKRYVSASRSSQARPNSQPRPIWPWILSAALGVVLVGAAHPAYNSDPPTGGWHYDTPWDPGFYEQPVADEYLVHNLEHGHVVISYDCSKLTDCETTKARIRRLIQRYSDWKVVAVPRTNRDAPLALTASGWLLKLDGYDEAKMTAFIDARRDRGPEHTEE